MCDSRSDEQIAQDIRNSLGKFKKDCAILICRGWSVDANVREYSPYSSTGYIYVKDIKNWSVSFSKTRVESL